jgi:hypothetical protein
MSDKCPNHVRRRRGCPTCERISAALAESSFAEPTGSGTIDEEIWLKAKREHDATGQILDALRPVSQNERRRILNYFWDKYVVHPDSPNE